MASAAVALTIGLATLPAKSHESVLSHLPYRPCSVLSGHPCHPAFCGVFHRGPCLPYYLPPFGQDLRLTIVSTDASAPADENDKNDKNDKNGGDAGRRSEETDNTNDDAGGAADDHALNSIREMFAALRSCWVLPPKDEARHGMEYTIRFAFKRDGEMIAPPRMTYSSHDAPAEVRDLYRGAIDAALKRCTPLHFSEDMGEAVAGRPIAIRFVDDRTIDKDTGK